jgi:hypothetical protein
MQRKIVLKTILIACVAVLAASTIVMALTVPTHFAWTISNIIIAIFLPISHLSFLALVVNTNSEGTQ